MKRHTERVVAAAAVVLAASAVSAGDWPLFRGDPRLTGVAGEALPANLEPLWIFETDEEGFEATATVHGDAVYVGSLDGHVYALDGDSGLVFWAYDTGNRVFSVAPVGDLDLDGRPEVVAGTQDTTNNVVVHVLDGNAGLP